jgi:hypothetical protein
VSHKRKEVEVETSMGKAVATPQPSPFNDSWLINTPWGDVTFFGTANQARAEIKRIARENEGDDEDE